MALSRGTRLGPYELLALLGAGAMGEVHRARDTRLKREIALKVLHAEVRDDPGRRSRFEQEARAISALNHPGIVTIHDIGDIDGVLFIVTELIDGESLRDMLVRGPLSLPVALDIGLQVAGSLGAAHASGIIHRDLKPENIMVTRDGRAKILDFGLAKPRNNTSIPDATVTLANTEPGIVMGTPAYMSPEQVRGRELDHRSDIFSFGLILYELLSGKAAFRDETTADTMAGILHKPTPELPPQLEQAQLMNKLLSRCLAKDSEARFASCGDLAFAMEAVSARRGMSEPIAQIVPPPAKKRVMKAGFVGWLAAGLVLGAGAMYWWKPRETPDPPTIRYLTYSGHDSSPDVSSDGRTVAFTSDRDGKQRIWLKHLQTGGETPLTEGNDDFARFSPDGSRLLFLRSEGDSTSLYRSGIVAGEQRKLMDNVSGADWSPDGQRVVFVRRSSIGADASSAVSIMSADGASVRDLAVIHGELLEYPRWSGDGETIALVPEVATTGAAQFVFLIDVKSGAVRRLRAPGNGYGVSGASWSGTGDQLVYSVAESITGAVSGNSGEAAWIVSQNARTGVSKRIFFSPYGASIVGVAGNGQLIFDTRSPRESLREFGLGKTVEPQRWLTRGSSKDRQPAYSRDGEHLMFSSTRGGNLDLWELTIRTGVLRRVTSHGDDEDWDPAYMPDGKRILWSSSRGGHLEIWIANVGGLGARQVTHDGVDAENPTATPDGKWILYESGNETKRGVWRIQPDGSEAKKLVSGDLWYPETSPDGEFVAYRNSSVPGAITLNVASVEDGSTEKFEVRLPIRNLHNAGSVGRSRWMPNGKAIAFIGQNDDGINGIYVQNFVKGTDTSATRRPLCCFDADSSTESFGIAPDGDRMTVAAWEQVFSLVSVDRVPGVAQPVYLGGRR